MRNKKSNELLQKIVLLSVICLIPIISIIKGLYNDFDNYLLSRLNREEKTVVTLWTDNNVFSYEMNSLVDKFNNTIGKEENIFIEFQVIPVNYDEILNKSLLKGSKIDIFTYKKDKEYYGEKGFIIPLEDMPRGKEFIKGFYDEEIIEKQKIYSVPYSISTIKLFYNKSILEKASLALKEPTNWEDFLIISNKINERLQDIYTFIIPMDKDFYNQYILYPSYTYIGHVGYNEKINKYEFNRLYQYFTILEEMKANGYLFPGYENIDETTAQYLFASGKVAFKIGTSYEINIYNNVFPMKDEWGVLDMPTIKGYPNFGSYNNIEDLYVIGSSASEIREEVMTVYEWLHSEDILKYLFEKELIIPYNNKIRDKSFADGFSQQWIDCLPKNQLNVVRSPKITNLITGDYIRNSFTQIINNKRDKELILYEVDYHYNKLLK